MVVPGGTRFALCFAHVVLGGTRFFLVFCTWWCPVVVPGGTRWHPEHCVVITPFGVYSSEAIFPNGVPRIT